LREGASEMSKSPRPLRLTQVSIFARGSRRIAGLRGGAAKKEGDKSVSPTDKKKGTAEKKKKAGDASGKVGESKPVKAGGKENGKEGDKKRAKKAGKDPNKPKRPKSPFFVYLDEFRASHKDLDNKDMVVQAGKEWQTLSEKDKTPYEKKAAKLRKEYETNMETYKTAQSKTKNAKKPKRPMSAFLHFMADFRKKHENKYSITEMVSKGGVAWKELDSKEKKKYESMAEKAKKDYEVKMKEWAELPDDE